MWTPLARGNCQSCIGLSQLLYLGVQSRITSEDILDNLGSAGEYVFSMMGYHPSTLAYWDMCMCGRLPSLDVGSVFVYAHNSPPKYDDVLVSFIITGNNSEPILVNPTLANLNSNTVKIEVLENKTTSFQHISYK